MEIMKETPWSRIRGNKTAWTKTSRRLLAMESKRAVRKETIAVSDTIWISVQNRHSRTLLRDLLRSRMREMHREPEVLEAEVQVEECLDCRAWITSKEIAPLHSVNNGILHAHRQVDEQPSKGSHKNGDKSAVAMLKKIARQLGCVFQDMEPPKSTTILRKSSHILKPIRCVCSVMLTFETKIHRLERFAQVILISVTPNAPKFEDRSQEETEWQERCDREAAWKPVKKTLKIKGET